jgi:hypothetical protein
VIDHAIAARARFGDVETVPANADYALAPNNSRLAFRASSFTSFAICVINCWGPQE